MPFKSSEIPPTAQTEHQRTIGKSRLAPVLAGAALSFTLTACGNMFPGGSLPSETATAAASPSTSEASGPGSILDADGAVTIDEATEWCDTIQSSVSTGLGDLFPDSTKTLCNPSTTGSALSGEGGAASDTSRWLSVSSSYAALPILAVTSGVECSPSSLPTECTSVKDQTRSLFREFAGQVIVFRYHAPEAQSAAALTALQQVAGEFQP